MNHNDMGLTQSNSIYGQIKLILIISLSTLALISSMIPDNESPSLSLDSSILTRGLTHLLQLVEYEDEVETN